MAVFRGFAIDIALGPPHGLPSVRPLVVLFFVLLAGAARAADVPVTYVVDDRVLRAAQVGTVLSFELYGDSECTVLVAQEDVPIERVDLIERLTLKRVGGASRPPRAARIHHVMSGVTLPGQVALVIDGPGILAVGGRCQAQQAAASLTVPDLRCWDLDADAACNLALEDMNGDGVCDVFDCQGPSGPPGAQGASGPPGPLGPQGPQGPAGAAGTGGSVGATGPQGPPGPTGPAGAAGAQGAAGSPGPAGSQGAPGPAGAQGIQGIAGPQGVPGQAGIACWDFNANRTCDLIFPDEDITNDGLCSILDCKGPQGVQGLQGLEGLPCWDLDGDGACTSATEDLNLDQVCDAADCTGPQGPVGPPGINTFAVCAKGDISCNCNGSILLSKVIQTSGGCSVTADTGACSSDGCSAGTKCTCCVCRAAQQ